MRRKPVEISPKNVYMIIMMLQFLVLLMFLVQGTSAWVFLLFLMAVFSIVLRWRFPIRNYVMLYDATLHIIMAYLSPEGSLILILFVFYFVYNGRILFALYPLSFGLYFTKGSESIYFAVFFLLGLLLYLWDRERQQYLESSDELRKRIYQLEETEANLLVDYQDTERLSRLTERQRIAEILHDNLGHELTAAHLSLKAAETILAGEDTSAKIPIRKSMVRLDNSLTQLKAAVSQLEPEEDNMDIDIEEMAERFPFPISKKIEGNVRQLKPYIRQLLHMSLKEALTNASKHAEPKLVEMSLEVTETIVRLTVKNDGVYEEETMHTGNGIRYMRKRLEAVNGSLSTQRLMNTFMLVIIIPLHKG